MTGRTVTAQASYKKCGPGYDQPGQEYPWKVDAVLVDHFGNETSDIGNANWAYKQHNLIRQYAFGNFKQLIDAITKDIHMLRYLNGYLSVASAPDENYARS